MRERLGNLSVFLGMPGNRAVNVQTETDRVAVFRCAVDGSLNFAFQDPDELLPVSL
jgi:hypothetical protein